MADRKVPNETVSAKRAAFETLAKFEDYRGHTPLAALTGAHASDRAARYLSAATSMLGVLSTALEDADKLGDRSELTALSGSSLAGALDGIAALVELGNLAIEAE